MYHERFGTEKELHMKALASFRPCHSLFALNLNDQQREGDSGPRWVFLLIKNIILVYLKYGP